MRRKNWTDLLTDSVTKPPSFRDAGGTENHMMCNICTNILRNVISIIKFPIWQISRNYGSILLFVENQQIFIPIYVSGSCKMDTM